MKSIAGILLLGVLLCLAGPASAIYRCEEDGKLTYSDLACPGGIQIRAGGVTSEEATAARKRAVGEKKQLNRMEAEQRKQTRRQDAAQRRSAKVDASHQKRCTTLERRRQWAQEDTRLTTPKTDAKARQKARRAAEQYELECGMLNRLELGISG